MIARLRIALRESFKAAAAEPDNAWFAMGLALVAGGFFLAWPPLGLIVPGFIICGLVITGWILRTLGASGAPPSPPSSPPLP